MLRTLSASLLMLMAPGSVFACEPSATLTPTQELLAYDMVFEGQVIDVQPYSVRRSVFGWASREERREQQHGWDPRRDFPDSYGCRFGVRVVENLRGAPTGVVEVYTHQYEGSCGHLNPGDRQLLLTIRDDQGRQFVPESPLFCLYPYSDPAELRQAAAELELLRFE